MALSHAVKLFVCIDGFDPDYLRTTHTPNLDFIAENYDYKLVTSALPSVTNVNNVSLVTASSPDKHGISCNYFVDSNGHGHYMEEPDFVRQPVLGELAEHGRVLVLVAKDKLSRMIGRGAQRVISAEAVTHDLITAIGKAPEIYSAEVSLWLFKALEHLLKDDFPYDTVYLSTTDYVMHRYRPEDEEAICYIEALDAALGRLLDYPNLQMCITADHGMNDKTQGIDLVKLLARQDIPALFIPAIKDRYTVHHNNQGGFAYLYIQDAQAIKEANICLQEAHGIHQVYFKEQHDQLNLPSDRIGDLIVLADEHTVFGEYEDIRTEVKVRTHGSSFEQQVPMWLKASKRLEAQHNYEALKQFF